MGANIIGGIVAFVVGTGLATATVIGVISSQTAPPDSSPVDASKVEVAYGS